jgi:hypothetical protein
VVVESSSEEEEEEEEEKEDSFECDAKEMALFMRKFKKYMNKKKGDKKSNAKPTTKRICYNYDKHGHFIANCPFERRDDDEDKKKTFPQERQEVQKG